jgi:hypothetical protein
MGSQAVDSRWIDSRRKTVHRFSHPPATACTPGLIQEKPFNIKWLQVFSRKLADTTTTSF